MAAPLVDIKFSPVCAASNSSQGGADHSLRLPQKESKKAAQSQELDVWLHRRGVDQAGQAADEPEGSEPAGQAWRPGARAKARAQKLQN